MNAPFNGKRCAIYCRKSTDDGLDQQYNSLDAQRASCEHYIASQSINGWVALEKHYDDGGYSGGNTHRPALQDLLQDINDGKIDVVVVYKIDRLSRSLLDFADMLQTFDQHKVSFVSSTQQIDTGSSAGRMMLNILMTFAQFEREIISERIRDKMSSSRRKGMWVGGTVPFGYMLKDKLLIPHPEHAKTLQYIYQRYLELASVPTIAEELQKKGIVGPKGRDIWRYETIYRFLSNPAYIGKVLYKGEVYDGVHEPLISQGMWDEVQKLLANRTRATSPRHEMKTLLGGLIRCGHCGFAMSPTYSQNPEGLRYYYYACGSLANFKPKEPCPVKRVSASEVDAVIEAQIFDIVKQRTFCQALVAVGMDADDIRKATRSFPELWAKFSLLEKQRILQLLIDKVVLYEDHINLHLKAEEGEEFKEMITEDGRVTRMEDGTLRICLPFSFRRISGRRRIVQPTKATSSVQAAYKKILRAIAEGILWRKHLVEGRYRSLSDLAREMRTDVRYTRRKLSLAILSPGIITRLIQGAEQGEAAGLPDITLAQLIEVAELPWPEQHKKLGIA